MKKRGFTIIELLVSMSLFAIVSTIAVGAFINILSLQRKAFVIKETQQNARNTIETISKYARIARTVTVTSSVAPYLDLGDNNQGSRLELRIPTKDSVDDEEIKTLVYEIKEVGGVKVIQASGGVLNGSIGYVTTQENITVTNLGFTKIDRKLVIDLTISDNSSTGSIFDEDKTTITTTVSLEGLDIVFLGLKKHAYLQIPKREAELC